MYVFLYHYTPLLLAQNIYMPHSPGLQLADNRHFRRNCSFFHVFPLLFPPRHTSIHHTTMQSCTINAFPL